MKEAYCMVTTTVDSEIIANTISQGAIAEKLAACVQMIPGVISHYEWHGKLEKTQELLLQFKTTENLVENLMQYIKSSHTYDTPEIIMIKIGDIDPDYGKWLYMAVNKDLP
ncbi:MAG: divalent-cation tolerance protein CutA [Candidatus Marinimicrobia bacterium]|nr:divalent-cation tolerance protein CutA [Candidatus Neomarinimicrobiota bacterium]